MLDTVDVGMISEHLVGILMVVEKQQEGTVGAGERIGSEDQQCAHQPVQLGADDDAGKEDQACNGVGNVFATVAHELAMLQQPKAAHH